MNPMATSGCRKGDRVLADRIREFVVSCLEQLAATQLPDALSANETYRRVEGMQ
jgi:hypothetical protein